MALVERVTPYIPECSDYDQGDFVDNWQSRGQYFNLTDAGTYVFDKVVPSLIPGIVLGALALLGCLIFLTWMFVGCCTSLCCRKRAGRKAEPAGATEQFIAGGGEAGGQSYAYPAPDTWKHKRVCSWSTLFWAFYVALALALIGISAWGLAESVKLTDDTVSDFWGLVDEAQGKVEASIGALQVLEGQSRALTNASLVLSENQAATISALQQVTGVSDAIAQNIASGLASVPAALEKAPEGLQAAIDFLQDSVNNTITDLESDFKPPTMALENTWRFIPIAVLFGVLIVVAAVTVLAVYFMTWLKTTAFLVALLWLVVALLMLLGTGLLNGVYVVSGDACLYAESYAVAYAAHKAGNSKWGDLAVFLVRTYIGQGGVNVTDAAAVVAPGFLPALPGVSQEAGSAITRVLQEFGDGADRLMEISNSPQLQALLPPPLSGALTMVGSAVGALQNAVGNLTEIAAPDRVQDLYHGVKEYICCTLQDSARDMWVAWTVAGCLGFVLALLSSVRIVKFSLAMRKKRRSHEAPLPGGAVLWKNTAAERGPLDKASDAYEVPPTQTAAYPTGTYPAAR